MATYYILKKIELVEGNVQHNDVGYITDSAKAASVSSSYSSGLGAWIETNKADLMASTTTMSDYFGSNPAAYRACSTTTYIPEGLTEITDVTPYI